MLSSLVSAATLLKYLFLEVCGLDKPFYCLGVLYEMEDTVKVPVIQNTG